MYVELLQMDEFQRKGSVIAEIEAKCSAVQKHSPTSIWLWIQFLSTLLLSSNNCETCKLCVSPPSNFKSLQVRFLMHFMLPKNKQTNKKETKPNKQKKKQNPKPTKPNQKKKNSILQE